jgi:hypothetical protein
MSFAWKDDHMGTFLEIYRNHECLWNNKSENYQKINISLKTYKTLHSELNLPHLSVNDKKLNSVALVRERTIPTERPPPVGEVSANFSGRGVSRGQRNGSPRPLITVF